MAEFENIISVGGNCAVTKAIRDHFGVERAFPFDWWLVHINSIRMMIEAGFEKMFEEDEMRVLDIGEATVDSSRYKAMYHHDFERDANNQIVPDIARQLPKVREKYAFLIDRLDKSLSAGRTLFVRYDLDQGADDDFGQRWTWGIEFLHSAQTRWPNADLTLLCIVDEHTLPKIGNLPSWKGLLWDTLGPPTGEMWRSEQFGNLFGRRNVRLVSP